MNEYFKIAEDLDEDKKTNIQSEGASFFKIAEDLDEDKKTNIQSEGANFFKVARDLDGDDKKDIQLNHKETEKSDLLKNVNLNDEINNYLLNVVSGKELGFECEMGTLCGAGNTMVSFKQLQEMVNDGTYNIISARVFNPDMIEIRYEKYNKKLKMFK